MHYSDRLSLSLMSFFCPRILTGHLCLWAETVFQTFLVLMNLTVWSQVFCRMALCWDLSGVFLMVGLGFGEEDLREEVPFSSHMCPGHVPSV